MPRLSRILIPSAILILSSAVVAADLKDQIVGDRMPGWEQKGGGEPIWSVKDGVLACTGAGGGWWGTKADYTDFLIELEFKLPAGGNSGVFLRATPKGDPAYVAFEVQVLDDYDPQYKDILPSQHCGSIYKIAAPSKEVLKKAGEWNAMRITAKADHLTVELNGTKIVDADGKNHPEILKRSKQGAIGLQNHSTGVWYRHVRLADLTAHASATSGPAATTKP
jgi:hypothetical protein